VSDVAAEAPDLDMPAIAPPESSIEDSGDGEQVSYRRVVSDKVRAMFKDAAAKVSDQMADGGDDGMEVAIKPPDDQPAAAADVAPGATGTQTTPSAVAAPALDAATNRKGLELEVRERSLADREAKLVEREKSSQTLEAFAARYAENPSSTLRDAIKVWAGVTSDDEFKDEVAGLITELSATVLGLPVSDEVKQRAESKRAVRTVKQMRADMARRETEAAERAQAERAQAEQTKRETDAMAALAPVIKAKADAYPHLSAEDDPHAIVWDVIKTKASRDANWVPNWEEAAKLADDHFRAQHEKLRQKLSRLPTPATKPAAVAVPQGAAQGRAARTLTNASTAPLAPSAPVDSDEPYDRETARQRSRAILRAQLEKRTT
jgi:hypothetical protein